jgi:hypothetical protein
MRYWGDIELPDEDELAETADSAYISTIDATLNPLPTSCCTVGIWPRAAQGPSKSSTAFVVSAGREWSAIPTKCCGHTSIQHRN